MNLAKPGIRTGSAPRSIAGAARERGGDLICDAVGKVYERSGQPLEVLRDIVFEVRAGEFVSLLGPSGCGKSTLLRIVEGLIPATSGRVTIDGREVTGPGPERGFVFQSDSLLPWRTIEANVGIGLELSHVDAATRASEVRRLLEMVGLAEFAQRYPHELSGGMRQRANLARALAPDPEILLMDEPFGALDAQTRELMQAELLRLWAAEKKTVLFVTHSIEEAVFLSDRILVMSARPGTVRTDLEVRLPRPRTQELRRSAEVAELSGRIWEDLRDDAVMAFEGEAG